MITTFTGKDGVQTYRATVLKSALTMYAKHRIKANRAYTPTNMLRAAGQITGETYKRGQYAEAITDLENWLLLNGTTGGT